MKSLIVRFPSLVFNLLFLGYQLFLGPIVLTRLLRVTERDATDFFLAFLFLSAPFLEMVGFFLAVPALLERLAKAPRLPVTLPVVIWQAHLVLTLILMLNGFACIGFDTSQGPPLLGIVLVTLIVIKEIGYLLYWILHADPERLARSKMHNRLRGASGQPGSPFLAGLMFLPVSTLGFTGLWDLLIGRYPIYWSQPLDAILELGLAVFIFLLIFGASRSIFLIEEWAFLRGRWPTVVWAGTLMLNLVVALASLPAG